LPLLGLNRGLGGLKMEESMTDSEVTIDYLCDNVWLVGSPSTVARKIRDLYSAVGGFGTILIGASDWQDSNVWDHAMELFANQVMPQVADLGAPAELIAGGPR
jgi:alkanesulfonate monooxygenase SsuD/methylene tetrahydromethanopterin reductase-like flavin-dependent oxidoreductase (luciferase family)